MTAPVDVAEWLAALGLSAYAQAFRDNDIDGTVLTALTADDLREIGGAHGADLQLRIGSEQLRSGCHRSRLLRSSVRSAVETRCGRT